MAQSATSTSLAISSGGSPVTSVKEVTAVTLTATVVAGSTPVTRGQVEFCDAAPPHCSDIHLMGTAQLTAAGTAVLTYYPPVGAHTYQAVFVGTNSARTSSGSAPLQVSLYAPSYTEITYPYFLAAGTYSLDVMVTGSAGSTPTGTVSILDTANGNYVLGTATLMPGGGSSGGGDGFAPYVHSTTSGTGYAAVGDFNGDGKKDLAVGTYQGSSVSVMLGSGSGTFSAGQNLSVGPTPNSIAVADFDGDGKQDLVVSNYGSYNSCIYPSVPPPPVAPQPCPQTWLSYPVLDPVTSQGSVTILMGKGDGTFTAKALPALLNPAPTFVATGDFNGDGIPDLAVTNATTTTGTAVNTVVILLGNGDGTFTLKSNLPVGNKPVGAVTADFNHDGAVDLVVANMNDSTLTVLLGNGDGTFRAPVTIPSTSKSEDPTVLSVADFDGDGNLDLAVAHGGSFGVNDLSVPGSIAILLGNGDGTFHAVPEVTTRFHLNTMDVGDFNADGKPDLVISDYFGEQLVMLGNGDGTFGAPTAPTTGGFPMAVEVGDFNGDGVADIASPSYLVLDTSSPLRVSWVDVLLSLGGAPASVLTATTTVSNFFVVGTGNHNVVASYSGDSINAPSVSAVEGLTAQPEPTTVALSANPSTSNYGQAVMLTAVVTPSTAQNHTATGTVTFTLGNTVVGTSSLVGGVATFQTSSLPAGANSLTATYSGDQNFGPSTGTTTANVNGAATTVVLTVAPNPAIVGQTVTLSAAVIGVGLSSTPTGLVTFYNGATSLGQVAVDANGHASTTLTGLAFGSYAITAAYSGDAAFYPSTSPATTLVVGGYASVTTLTAAPNPAGFGQPMTMTASVTGVGSTSIAAGAVTFYDGVAKIGSGTLDVTGRASATTSVLALGVHSLTAVYGGSAIYSSSTSTAVQETVETPGFTVTLSNPSVTLATYHHTTTGVTLASAGDFSDQLTLKCGNAPVDVTCIFTPAPASLVANGSATVSFYIDTDSIVGGDTLNGPLTSPLLLMSPFGLVALLGWRRRRGLRVWVVLAVVALGVASGGCGGSTITAVPSTPPGVYTISVTGTGATSGITRSAQLTLTVTR
jgi:hypothetical protein